MIKFDTNGNPSYLKSVDFGNQLASIDVFGVDKINVISFTTEANILNYPVNNLLGSNAYVATFGVIDTPYLSLEKNYATLITLLYPITTIRFLCAFAPLREKFKVHLAKAQRRKENKPINSTCLKFIKPFFS